MTDQPDESPIDRLRDLARNHPLPPIGSFEADLVRPPIGRVKLGDVGDGLWIWPDSGEPEGLTWDNVGFIGQRGSLLKISWARRELLLEFGTNTAALDAAGMISANARGVVPPPPSAEPKPQTQRPATARPEPVVEIPVVDVAPATSSAPETELVQEAPTNHAPSSASVRAADTDNETRPDNRIGKPGKRSPIRRIATGLLALGFIVAAAVGGIVIGQRLIGDGPAASDAGPRPVVIREATGEGDQVLGTFVADGPWKVLWENQGDGPLTIVATDASGTRHLLVDAEPTGQDAAFSELTGRVTVTAEGDGPWRVALVERDPGAAADQ